MITTYVVIGQVCAVLLVCRLAYPSANSPHGRARRRRAVQADPGLVLLDDLIRELRRDGIAPGRVTLVLNRARRLGIALDVQWRWLAAHGAVKFLAAIEADLIEPQLVAHLDAGTEPDLDELLVFAAANGFATPPIRPRRAARS